MLANGRRSGSGRPGFPLQSDYLSLLSTLIFSAQRTRTCDPCESRHSCLFFLVAAISLTPACSMPLPSSLYQSQSAAFYRGMVCTGISYKKMPSIEQYLEHSHADQ